ncbi:MAG: hypothetical protein RRY11_07430 [Terrisporobacter sp.]
MNKFISLLKYSLINSYGLNKIKTASKNDKIKSIITIIASVAGIIFIILMFNKLAMMMININLPIYYILLLTFMISAIGILYFSIYRAPSTIFAVKDYDLLASLPIKEKNIVLVKLADLIITNYIFLVSITIPSLIIYYKYVSFSFTSLITNTLGFIALPFIPMSIGVFVGYIVYIIASKFRRKDTMLTIINLTLYLTFISIVYTVEKWGGYFIDNFDGTTKVLECIYLPFKYFSNAIGMRSISDIIIYLLSSIVIFLVFILIIKNKFYKLNATFNVYTRGNAVSINNSTKQSVLIALLKSEFLRYISKSTVVFNTIAGPSLYVLLICLFGFGFFDLYENFIVVLTIGGILIFSLLPITATTISLEGKSFYILKTLPIKPKEIIKSKLLLNLIVNLPFVIIGAILMMVFKLGSFGDIIISVITIIFSVLFITCLSMIINMKFYNLKWSSEGAVINKSPSVVINIICVIITTAIVNYAGVNYKFLPSMVYIVLSIILGYIINKYGENMFDQIS